MILVGDIGGTNCRLALFDDDLHELKQSITPHARRGSFLEIVREFLATLPANQRRINRACFGVAGPVSDGRVQLTNINWELDEATLSRELGIAKVALINDLLAHAEGVELLRPEHLVVLHAGKPVERGNRAIIAAGTGLGEAGIVWEKSHGGYRAVASEGGHCDFSPRDEREIALLRYLKSRMRIAEWEGVLSGPGMRHLYDFLCTPEQLGPSMALANSDPSPSEISEAGLNGSNRVCVEAMDLFVRLYGAEAGNLALKMYSVNGVYLGGGIAPRIISKLKAQSFLDAFQQKGPEQIRPTLRQIPIYVITFEMNAVYGAANYARRM